MSWFQFAKKEETLRAAGARLARARDLRPTQNRA